MKDRRSERGSATVELLLLAPVFALLIACVIAVGRVQSSRADIEGVAQAAARSITLSRSPTSAVPLARNDAAASVHEGSATCRRMGWSARLTAERVTVEVTCSVDLSAATSLPLPGTYVVSGRATEAIDRFKEGR